jgi:ribosome-associated heat shock protein Hsp15
MPALVRTRADAAGLAGSGLVRINSERIRAAGHTVRHGDVITVALDRKVRVLKVRGLAERRGSAAAGRELYDELM